MYPAKFKKRYSYGNEYKHQYTTSDVDVKE